MAAALVSWLYVAVFAEMHSWAMRGGLGGNVSARVAEVVRASVGVGASLVHGYLAGAIDTMLNYKKIETEFITKC